MFNRRLSAARKIDGCASPIFESFIDRKTLDDLRARQIAN